MTEYRIDPGYAHGRIARALSTAAEHPDPATRERALDKIARWQQVLAGLADGTLDIGSRTPVDAPAWATLEVLTGGFATGTLVAGGALHEHEIALAHALGVPADGDRTALNRHFLSDAGLADLAARVRDGRYDVDVPEEAALPTVAWLVEHGHADAARELVAHIAPYFARLRFYPVPRDTPRASGSRVFVQNARATVEILDHVSPNAAILAQREAVDIWAPLHDRAIAIMLEVVDDALPRRAFDAGWHARAAALLADYATLRREHRLTTKVDDPASHMAQLRALLARCVDAPATLTDGNIWQARVIVDSYVRKRGRPGSASCVAARARERAAVAAPLHAQFAAVAARRVERCAPDEGVDDVDALTVPLDAREAEASGIAAGTALPASVRRKIARCRADTAQALVEHGLIASSETLALVLPQLTSGVRALGIDDAALRGLYAATYRAFRRRRSLLLVDLAKQVQITELPWVASIDAFRRRDIDAATVARRTLEEAAALALASFPATIVPNRLVQEFGTLAKSAGLDLPLTEEVAADIFMGRFSPKFAAAARVAADALGDSLYATYYGIDWNAVHAVAEPSPRRARASRETDAFAQLCATRAGATSGRHRPATNGTIIEQQQILTTHNLAVLFVRLDLATQLGERLDAMALAAFAYVCARLQLPIADWRAQLTTIKNCAYAWRQMLFFASQLPAPRREAVLRVVNAHFDAQSHAFRARFAPAMRGLALAARGESPDDASAQTSGARRFLGWCDGRHWLMTDPET